MNLWLQLFAEHKFEIELIIDFKFNYRNVIVEKEN